MLSIFKNLFKPSTDLVKLIREGALIIDVRSKNEFDSGHINGSKNIPLNRINLETENIKKLSKKVITVCRSGSRSSIAKSQLTSKGIEAYNGGAWTRLKSQIN